ncbi:MAG: Maf family nucleotide pyrophosphatase [Burkholderiales bacterium]|nr:Maf family nucleotide pyrophosphatase [Burkholderiales bacterium]
MAEKRIYLASRSPRRRELLKQIGVNFELLLLREDPRHGGDVDETPLPDELPDAYALRIASTKATVAARYVTQRGLPQNPVLAADTTVVLDGRILGKPANAGSAIQMLQALSGREHRVITAVAMARKERIETRISVSTVQFRKLSEIEIRHYVAGGEPLDKAGAYAIQGRAAAFITRIEGSYSGIMGLPLAETAELLHKFDIEVL